MPQDEQKNSLARDLFLKMLGGPHLAPEEQSEILHPSPSVNHPAGVREGFLESLIKVAGRGKNFFPDDDVYLEQYLHPEHDILEKQPLRPTKLSKIPDIPFRKPPGLYGGDELLGLGAFTESETPDYRSIYDVWDFDTPTDLFNPKPHVEAGVDPGAGVFRDLQNSLAKQVLKRAGTPYAVYERYPKDPKILKPGEKDPYEVITDPVLRWATAVAIVWAAMLTGSIVAWLVGW